MSGDPIEGAPSPAPHASEASSGAAGRWMRDVWVPGEHLAHLEQLAGRLRALRDAAGLTQDELAAFAGGWSRGTVAGLEQVRLRPRPATLTRLAQFLAFVLDLDSDALVAELLDLAGPALAPPSAYPDAVARPSAIGDEQLKAVIRARAVADELQAATAFTTPVHLERNQP